MSSTLADPGSGVVPAPDLAQGHYAKKQLFCKDWLIAWSHGRRLDAGVRLGRQFGGKRILDYGCGDGTLLALLASDKPRPARGVGCEIHAELVADCQARLGHLPGLSFVHADELDGPEHRAAYDAIFCTEVLEHVLDWAPLLDRFDRLLAPGGMLVVSVPVETGPALAVKQLARRIAGWRGLGDYPGQSPYTFREFWASVFAGRRQHIPRPVFTSDDGSSFYDHKGFNWRVLRDALAQRFDLERTFGSPLAWLPACLASQVWFQLRKRPEDG